jgi:hypothetical protein
LSYRGVQELLFERGIDVTHEAIRQWCLKFGQAYANQLKRRRAQPGDKWHLDEVFLTINGKRYYLWRAVDQDDNVLDILVQSRRVILPIFVAAHNHPEAGPQTKALVGPHSGSCPLLVIVERDIALAL